MVVKKVMMVVVVAVVVMMMMMSVSIQGGTRAVTVSGSVSTCLKP